jgi:hypothetical protein
MKKDAFLRLHVALLLKEHGSKNVIDALSELLGKTPMELSRFLRVVETPAFVKSTPRAAIRSAPSIQPVLDEHPAKAEVLKTLKDRYDNRTLLPELKDVRRFLDRHEQRGAIKSRTDATIKVFRLLAEMSDGDLETMLSTPSLGEASGLGVISDQILGRN